MPRFISIACLLAMCAFFSRRESARAQEPAAEASPDTGNINLLSPTMGGLQFWCDELFFHQWRIQRNVLTDHCRLLDESNMRHAWGTFEQCHTRLEQIKRERSLPPMSGKAVIALHGLIRTRSSMGTLCDYLHAEGDYQVFNVNYPSTQADVAKHAAAVAKIVARLDGIEEIYFVSHSLGGLVIRHYLADTTDPVTGLQGDPRVRRVVMLGPPNNGAELAEKLGRNQVFKAVFGTAGNQLAREWPELVQKLALPRCEFGIIAGGKGNDDGLNPLLAGDDDGVVSVATTQLPGARDFEVLPLGHTFMMYDRTLQQHVLNFFQTGCFVAEEQRRPLP